MIGIGKIVTKSVGIVSPIPICHHYHYHFKLLERMESLTGTATVTKGVSITNEVCSRGVNAVYLS